MENRTKEKEMQTIEEKTGLESWKLVIAKERDLIKVSIQGPRGGEKAWVRIPAKDLVSALNREMGNINAGKLGGRKEGE